MLILSLVVLSCQEEIIEPDDEIKFCLYKKRELKCVDPSKPCPPPWTFQKCVTLEEALNLDREVFKIESCDTCK